MPPAPIVGPEPLAASHATADFCSGAPELDEWLQKYALVNHRSGNARVFVAHRDQQVVGFYALATAGVTKAETPEALTKGSVPAQVPCLLLARLAVDEKEANRGLGRALLSDALRRALRVSDDVAFRAVLIHARDEIARSFYLHQAEFVDSPSDPMHLFLSLKQLQKSASPE